jgi:3-oxoacyl-(acyl-carrier-protein) synthase
MKSAKIYSPPRRVAVTGIGAVAPNGIGAAAYCAALRGGVSGVAPITLFDAGALDCRVAAEVKHFSIDTSSLSRKCAGSAARCRSSLPRPAKP